MTVGLLAYVGASLSLKGMSIVEQFSSKSYSMTTRLPASQLHSCHGKFLSLLPCIR